MKRARSSTAALDRSRLAPARHPWLWGGALVLLVLAVYATSLGNGFVWDDDDYIVDNQALRSTDGLHDIWFKLGTVPQYYPLTHTTLWLEYQLWGLDPRGFHLVNLLLHALSAVLVWRLLLRLGVAGAWLAAAIFAVHPVAVESVAWLTELKNVQSCVFVLAAMLAYLRFAPAELAEPGTRARITRGPWRFYALALALYVAALLSKTVTATMPAVLLVIYWWKQGRFSWREVAQLTPLFALGLALATITIRMEHTEVGAVGEEWNLSPAERVLIAGRALWFYAAKLAWPHPLIFFYPRWMIDQEIWWQFLFPMSAIAVIVALWLTRARIGRGPLAAVLIFAGVLTPALGFFDVFPFRYSFVADHFQYQACIALVALAAATGVTLASRFTRLEQRVTVAFAAGVLLALGVTAARRTHAYQNLASLHEDTLAQNPQAWVAPLNLGYSLYADEKYAESIPLLCKAVEIRTALAEEYPQVNYLRDGLADCMSQLAAAQHKSGASSDAEETHRRAIEIREQLARENPQVSAYTHNLAGQYVELGIINRELGRLAESDAWFDKAIPIRQDLAKKFPDNAQYQRDLAWCYVHRALAQRAGGRNADAAASHRQALQIRKQLVAAHPADTRARLQLAQTYFDLGMIDREQGLATEAAESLQAAIEIRRQLVKEDPRVPELQDELAGTYAQYALAQQVSGNLPAATASHRVALEIRQALVRAHPDKVKFQNDLAASIVDLGFLGDDAEAESAFRRAIDIREAVLRAHPEDVNVRASLAATYQLLAGRQQRLGRPAEAAASRRRLCALRDELAEAHPQVVDYYIEAAAGYVDLAFLERELGRRNDAANAFRRAIALREQALKVNPSNSDVRSHLAGTFVELSIDQRELGQIAEAVASCETAIKAYDQLLAQQPSDSDYEAGLGWACANLGVAQLVSGQPGNAIAPLRRSVDLREHLVRSQFDLSDRKLSLEAALGWSYANLGVALSACGELDEAESYLRSAIQIRSKVVQDNPASVDHQHEIALSCRDLGNVERALGRTVEAVNFYQAAIEIRRQIVADHPANAAYRLQLAADLGLCGETLAALREWSESAGVLVEAVQLSEGSWQTLWPCAVVQLAAGEITEYRATCEQIVKRHSSPAVSAAFIPLSLALVLGDSGPEAADCALALARSAQESDRTSLLGNTLRGAAEYRRGHFDDAIVTLTAVNESTAAALRANPLCGLACHWFLAKAYRPMSNQEKADEQLAILQDLIKSAPPLAATIEASLPAWTWSAVAAIVERDVNLSAALPAK